MLIEAVTPSRFPSWVRQRPFMVLFLGSGGAVRRPRGAVAGLDDRFPGRVGAGWLSADAVSSPGWWTRHWQTELGPYGRGGQPPPGVYLFHLGLVAGFNPSPAHAGGDADWLRVRDYLIDRIVLKTISGEGTDWSKGASGPREGAAPPPSRAALLHSEGPYDLLEIPPGSTDDEVKRAFRTALKLNHPDRVAHLSRAIQAFAQERTQRIIEAWQVIKEERGLR